jgi:hypothetical protein
MLSNLRVAITTFHGNPEYITNFGPLVNGTRGVQAVTVVRSRFPLNLFAAEQASTTVADYYNVTAWCGPSWAAAESTANAALMQAAPLLARAARPPPPPLDVSGGSPGIAAPPMQAVMEGSAQSRGVSTGGDEKEDERTPGWAIALSTVVSAGVRLPCMTFG